MRTPETRQDARILVFAASTMDQAAIEAAGHIAGELESTPLLLSSSLTRKDALVRSLRRSLRTHAVSSSVVVPGPPFLMLSGMALRMVFGARSNWRAVRLPLPDKPDRDVVLPDRLLGPRPLLYITHIDTVARRGPFQLDLLSRYLHPRHRLRQVIDPDRAGLAAEINLLRRPAWCIIGSDGLPGLVAVTRDIIAGELFALCMAERFFDRPGEFSSPWEDRVVQRATELELGARTPDDIQIEVVGGTRRAGEAANAIVNQIQHRIGIHAPGHG